MAVLLAPLLLWFITAKSKVAKTNTLPAQQATSGREVRVEFRFCVALGVIVLLVPLAFLVTLGLKSWSLIWSYAILMVGLVYSASRGVLEWNVSMSPENYEDKGENKNEEGR